MLGDTLPLVLAPWGGSRLQQLGAASSFLLVARGAEQRDALPQSQSADGLVGQVLQGTYRVTRRIARGGMGAVYAAEHVRLATKRYAIKVLLPATHGEVGRFRREAEVTSRLGHPHIVDVQDFNETNDGQHYMVMELLEGEDLGARLERERRLDAPEVATLVQQVAAALQAAHDHDVVHRDMKPGNIFLAQRADEALWAKVLDFGISKVKHGRTTDQNALLGTAHYMSPEQANGCYEAIDPRTDIFALGIIAYQALSGRLPFDAPTIPGVVYRIRYAEQDSLTKLSPEIPPRVNEVVARALAKDRKARYQRVADFADDLAEALEGVRLLDKPSGQHHEAPRGQVPTITLHPPPASSTLDLEDDATDEGESERSTETPPDAEPNPSAASADLASSPALRRRPWLTLACSLGVVALLLGAGAYLLDGDDPRAPSSAAAARAPSKHEGRDESAKSARDEPIPSSALAAPAPAPPASTRPATAPSTPTTTPAATAKSAAKAPAPKRPRRVAAPHVPATARQDAGVAPTRPDAEVPPAATKPPARARGFERLDDPPPPTGKGFDDL